MAHSNQPYQSGLISLFVRHKNAANLVMVLMVMFGVFALSKINTQFFPTTNIPFITVSIPWPGASAEDVERNILQVAEPELRFINGVDKVISRARESSGSVTLEFAQGSDMKQAQRDVETAVNTITNLPEDSETPKVTQAQFFDRVARLAVTGNVSEAVLRVYAKKIRDDLIDRGIDKISFTGLRDRELRVEIPERELRRLNLTISEVSKRISGNSRDIPSGQMDGTVEKQLRALADIRSRSALGNVEIKAFNSGEKVLLKDIAKIENGFAEGQPQGYSSGLRAIQLTVQRAETADTLATNKILSDYLDEIADQLPTNIKVTKYDVRANALTERIMLLVRNGLGGLILVVAILFIFLNARVALWVAMGIPTAMLATIGFMYISGQTINMVSLFGLIMMLGIIVDDAIVVGEHTATRFSAGDGSYVAAENGAGRMMKPVMAAMITTIAAFFPILLIRGTIGQIIGVLPLVVIAVIIASLIECFLVLPGHLAHSLDYKAKRTWSFWRQFFFSLIFGAALLGISLRTNGNGLPDPIATIITDIIDFRSSNKPAVFAVVLALASLIFGTVLELLVFSLAKIKNIALRRNRGNSEMSNSQRIQSGGFRRAFDRSFNWFKDRPFNKLVTLAFDWRYVTVAVSVASIMIGVYGLQKGGHVGFVFFPTAEAENLSARVVFHAGTPEEQTIAGVAKIEAALKAMEKKLTNGDEKLVVATFVTLGASGRNTGDHLAQIRVQLTTSEFRSVRTPDIVRGWRRAIPKIAGVKRVSVFEHRGGPPGRDIDIQLQGDNAGTLKAAASEIIPLVEAIDGASGVADDLPYGKPELIMELTPRGSALGFSIEDIGRQLRDSFEGAIPRRFADGDDEITVRVTQIMRQRGLAALRNFELRSPSSAFVALSEIVTIREQQGFSAIERINGKATISITADLDSKITTTEKAVQILENSGLSGITTKYGVSYKFGGRAEERKKAFEDLLLGAIIALMVIYIILAWVFSSYWRPFAVMLIIPFGVVGAVIGHWLLGFKLTILSFIALLGLAGILVNDSIILVSRLDERLESGDDLRSAAVGASRDRLRAVLLTSLTTIGGLMPLMYEKSLQAQFLLPMAITIVFGLAVATLLVLFLVPALVGIGNDISRLFSFAFGARGSTPASAAAE